MTHPYKNNFAGSEQVWSRLWSHAEINACLRSCSFACSFKRSPLFSHTRKKSLLVGIAEGDVSFLSGLVYTYTCHFVRPSVDTYNNRWSLSFWGNPQFSVSKPLPVHLDVGTLDVQFEMYCIRWCFAAIILNFHNFDKSAGWGPKWK